MRLIAPEFTKSAQIDGQDYEADDNGHVVVLNPDHAEQLKRLGFKDPNEVSAAPVATVQSGDTALSDPNETTGLGLVTALSYPAIVALLLSARIGFDDELPALDLLALTDEGLAAGQPEPAPAPEYTIGAFVAAALESAGLTDLSDLQAVLDAIEAQFEPFKAFDPDGDNAPGGRDPRSDDTLYGSSVLPAIVEVGGYKVQLGGIVAAAHAASQLSVRDWNDLPDAERERHLQELIDRLSAAPDTVEAVIAAPSIVERPAPAEAEVTDPAEKPDFANMPHAEVVAFLKARKYTFRGNPSNAVAVTQAEEYWAKKNPAA